MQENVEKEFLPLVSKPGWMMTWLIRIFLTVILLVMFIILAIFPLLVCENMKVLVVVCILYYPVWAIAIYHFFRFMKKGRKDAVIKITVDDKGLHYDQLNGERREILYSQLERAYFSDEYEVRLTPVKKSWVLTLRVEGKETRVLFNETDPGYSYYTRNARALRARFIEGIAHFRPDLKIDPFVFKELCIHPEKFTFDRRRYRKHVLQYTIVAGAFLLISLALIFIIVKMG